LLANSRSALKRIRITEKRTKRNRHVKSTMRTAVRSFRTAVTENNNETAELKLREAIRQLDKAVSKGVIHRNQAARKKSRLTKQLNRMQSADS
jgi:small subunit ribosomal protein S20